MLGVRLPTEESIIYEAGTTRFEIEADDFNCERMSLERSALFDGEKEGEPAVVLDDVLSKGVTLRALIKALQSIGMQVIDVLVVVEKGDHERALEDEVVIKVKTLVKFEADSDHLRVII